MQKKIKILILGQTGTLGSDLILYNNYFNFYEIGTIENHKWPTLEYINLVKNYPCDFIINCISINLDQVDKFNSIYYKLPLFLSSLKDKCIINFSSDILNDSVLSIGRANMNKYYEVKKKTENLINQNNFINIRTSFIGLAKRPTNYIFKLYNSTKTNTTIEGITNAYWSGVTTLQLYLSINNIININKKEKSTISLNSNCISNFDLVNLITTTFNFNANIKKIEFNKALSRCGSSQLSLPLLDTQIKDLYSFCKNINYLFE